MLLFNKPCCAASVRKLTIKLGGSAVASHQASIPPPQPKQSLRLKLKSSLTRPATHTAEPPLSLPLAQSQKQTLPHAKRFKPAPVERPVTRHFKRQQTAELKVHIRLGAPAQSAVTQRKSTLTHQQKRHGADIIRSTSQAEQRLQSDTDVLITHTQSLLGGAAAAVHQSDIGDASAAGLAGAPEAGHSNVKPAPMLSTMTISTVPAAAAAAAAAGAAAAAADATAVHGSGNTAAADAAAAAEADTADRPAHVALLKKATDVVVLPPWSSHHDRACGSLNDSGIHRWGLSQQLLCLEWQLILLMSVCLSQLLIVSPTVLTGMHKYQLTAASKQDVSVDNAAHRGLKRRATASIASQPPYKLVPANKTPITIPVVIYSSPIAGQDSAKRRHMGPSSSAFPTPWSLLTSRSSPSPVQRFLTARSLFCEAMPLGSRGSCSGTIGRIGNGQQLGSYTERVAHWHREQRELLQCLLQQQVANFNHASTTAETPQVRWRLLLCSQFINIGCNMCISCTDIDGCINLLRWRVCVSVLQTHFKSAIVCVCNTCMSYC